MKNEPVRWNGEFMYFVINFKSTEVANHEESISRAMFSSGAILEQCLPIDIIDYIQAPELIAKITESNSVLVHVEVEGSDIKPSVTTYHLVKTVSTIGGFISLVVGVGYLISKFLIF